MSITRPTGSYARQMLDPGGWVEADEDTFYDRAQEYSQVLQRVTNVLDTCRQQKGHVFEGGLWSGGAANAANGALGCKHQSIDDAAGLSRHGDYLAQAYCRVD